jgi:ABC-type antimicrobial peptide transport system permease subunit
MKQFVVESGLCGLMGAGVGLVLSEATVRLVTKLTYLPRAVSPAGILLCLLAGPVCGMLAGVIPALKARRVDPVEALRTE